MAQERNLVRTYLLSTIVVTWLLDLPAALASLGKIPGAKENYMALVGLGALTPLLLASVFQKFEGKPQRELFRLGGTQAASPLWSLSALFVPGGALLLGLFLFRLAGFPVERWFYLPLEKERLIALVLFPIGEEVGWRGYALPRLLQNCSPFRASFVVGLAWTAWHFMMFAIDHTPLRVYLLALPFFVVGSFVFTHFYQKTHGSLLAMILLHMGAHLNNSNRALPNTLPFLAHTLGFAVIALLLALSPRLSRQAASKD